MLRTVSQQFVSELMNIIYKSHYQNDVDQALHKSMNKLATENVGFGSKLERGIPLEQIVTNIKSDGFLIITDVLRGELLDKIKKEFSDIISSADETPHRVDRMNGATCVRLPNNNRYDLYKYPVTSAFFYSTILLDISRKYYSVSRTSIKFNHEIFVHETPETDNPLSGAMHWDRAQTLKFWVYVDDVPVEAGPMQVEKGSLERNKIERIKKQQNKNKLVGGVDNILEVKDELVVPLSAPEGSIVIHDTDASHCATQVKRGYIRRIMRGHTRVGTHNQ